MRAGSIGALRALPPLTSASALIYGAGTVLLILGLITWEPQRNPRSVLAVLAVAALGALIWTLARGDRFTMSEAFVFMALQLSTIAALTWNTNQDLGALANGTALPILGAYAVWFLRWPTGRYILYSGAALWFIAILHRDNSVLTGFALSVVFQTALATEVFWKIKARMDRLVRTDPLTGVLNLRGVTESLQREMSRSSRRDVPLSVVSIDLDGLRALNNTLGHRAGDDLLQAVTEHWRQEVRRFDVIGRTGGDEFLLVLPETSMDVAVQVVERLAESSPGEWSAGVAEAKSGDSVDSVLERADRRMYLEKAARQTN